MQADSASYHGARILFDRLGREIRGAYYVTGSGVTEFYGERVAGASRLVLTTTAVTPISGQGRALARVTYELLEADRGDQAVRVLERREVPLQLSSGEPLTQGRGLPLVTGVTDFRVRFFAAGSWHEEWNAATGGLPEMMEVRLDLMTTQGDEVPFQSAFDLPVRE